MNFDNVHAWPIALAKQIQSKIKEHIDNKGYVLFETGYGPSGLPHIGTFSEVLRTAMVLNAFRKICDVPTKLVCFSDDMDGLRKVPPNLPNKEMLAKYLNQPLSSIPDPFEKEESFSAYMNKEVKSFLNKFGFEYEIWAASHFYKSGKFDEYLIKVLEKYEAIMAVVIPTLNNRKETYSPFMPICKRTNKVLEVPTLERDVKNHTITYRDPVTNDLITTKVTGGNCKLQWKADMGMRWASLNVDFEMYGKDIGCNVALYSQICQILEKQPPVGFHYEHFLGENGEKISKSKGNSLDLDQWLFYAPIESLKLFIYQNPERAKKMHLGVIPKNVDDYLNFNEAYFTQNEQERCNNPVHHIHNGLVPQLETQGINFTMLINIASASNVENAAVLLNMVTKYYRKNLTEGVNDFLEQLIQKAYLYYKDFIKGNKLNVAPNLEQKSDLELLLKYISELEGEIDPQELQNYIYSLGMKNSAVPLKEYFKHMYQILLGQDNGPRLGSLLAILGKEDSTKLLQKHL
jgi:lysyl-tRNA synthetase, class I